MKLNKPIWQNRKRVGISEKLRRLEGIAYGRGLEKLLDKVNKCLVKFKRDVVEYRPWSN